MRGEVAFSLRTPVSSCTQPLQLTQSPVPARRPAGKGPRPGGVAERGRGDTRRRSARAIHAEARRTAGPGVGEKTEGTSCATQGQRDSRAARPLAIRVQPAHL